MYREKSKVPGTVYETGSTSGVKKSPENCDLMDYEGSVIPCVPCANVNMANHWANEPNYDAVVDAIDVIDEF